MKFQSVFFVVIALAGSVVLGAAKKDSCNGFEFLHSALDMKDKIGLKPGDVMLELDGHALSSPQESMQASDVMNLPGTHELTLERSGKKVKIKYEIAFAFRTIR